MRWGLAQMGTSGAYLRQVEGLLFYKLLGSGQGKGFSMRPNLRRYGLLCTWADEAAADAFLQRSALMLEYKQHTNESWTIKLLPYQSHGQWDGQQPFTPPLADQYSGGPIAVLTRASIRWRALPAFWRFVPGSSKALDSAKGLLCSIGLGELPLIRQATFSVWESAEAMRQYAYKQPHHQEVIRRTRAEKWYSEELFARFKLIDCQGSWDGINPLAQLLSGHTAI